jgi:hypothetical protein
VNYLAAEMMAGETLNSEAITGGRGSSVMSLDPMAQQEAALRDSMGQVPVDDANAIGHKRKFVPASNAAAPNKLPALEEASTSGGGARGSANPDEIDIDVEEGDGDDDEGAGHEREPAIKQKPVPLAVFGSAARAMAEDE